MLKIDWERGRASDGSGAACKRIVLIGDWVPYWDIKRGAYYDRVMAERPEKCYGETLDILRAADLRQRQSPASKRRHMR